MENHIEVFGARVHNLKNIDVQIPRNKLVVFTGKSGSGKSSLAFNTIHDEGQRRYLETFSAYARQFLYKNEKPDVDKINGLSPVVAIEQKTTNRNPRSTVGTITEIYDYLRLLYARIGVAYSYESGEKMIKMSNKKIIELIEEEYKDQSIYILSPIIRARKGHHNEVIRNILRKGYLKVRIDGEITEIYPSMKLERYKVHDIEIVIDRLIISKENKKRLSSSIETALEQGNNTIIIQERKSQDIRYFSKNLMCPTTGISYEDPEPNSFSFNSPKGACKYCNGLGFHKKGDQKKIIPDKNLSINQGAIIPIEGKNAKWFLSEIKKIGKKFNFNLSTPIKDIKDEALLSILYGINETFRIKLKDIGISKEYKINFNGIINFIEEKYQEKYTASITKWAEKYMSEYECKMCEGSRIKRSSRHYKIHDKTINDISKMEIYELNRWILSLKDNLKLSEQKIANEIIKALSEKAQFILNIGLDYLTINRGSRTLSGGEAQRIRLAVQIGSNLTNVLYILDEPSIGLHQKDNKKLIESLKELRDIGNSIIVVEHDKDMILASDYVVNLGPEAGNNGGKITFSGPSKMFIKSNDISARFISNSNDIKIPIKRRKGNGKYIKINNATGNNLKSINITIPLQTLCCITGVSGSGKSTLINKTLVPALEEKMLKKHKKTLPYKSIEGFKNIDKIIEITQSPIGRSPRSNPATYISVFSDIRELYASTNESKIRGYKNGRFSFNVKGGRCEECKGAGMKTIEMNFLPNVLIECDQCNGKRYNKETLEIKYKEKSIYDILNMTIDESIIFFKNIPSIYKKVRSLNQVGLGYMKLGQSATSLSGGEAQRVKISNEISKRNTGNTLYVFDEPTTGLHFEDIKLLLKIINELIIQGNTVLIIEHNLEVIKTADYIIDMGPEGGKKGGKIICNGTPEEIVQKKKGYTSRFLKEYIKI